MVNVTRMGKVDAALHTRRAWMRTFACIPHDTYRVWYSCYGYQTPGRPPALAYLSNVLRPYFSTVLHSVLHSPYAHCFTSLPGVLKHVLVGQGVVESPACGDCVGTERGGMRNCVGTASTRSVKGAAGAWA